jgi:putative ABC transport system permease protein
MNLSNDLRHSARALKRRPLAAIAAILALGIGIGGPAAVLSIMLSTSTLIPPGTQRPDELVMIWETPPREPGSRRDASFDTYRVWRANAGMFQQISGAGMPLGLSLRLNDVPERVRVQAMAADLLPLLGLAPEQGRAFAARDSEPGADPVAIVSHAFWETRLGSRPDIIGATLDLHGRHTAIVGVMPRAFWFGTRNVDVWVPLPSVDSESSALVLVVARLQPSDHREAAAARMSALGSQVAAAQPDRDAGWGVLVDGVGAAATIAGNGMPPGFKILLAAAILGLLAACANIATIMVARGAARHVETAIRTALGAARGRLIREFLVESLVVTLSGGVVATGIVLAALRLITTFAPPDFAVAINPLPSPWLVMTIMGISAAVGVLAGLGPALADSRVNPIEALKSAGYFSGAGGNSRLRRGLIIAEVTITVMLLAGVTILARGAIELASVGPGFDASRVIQVRIDQVQHFGLVTERALDVDTILARFTQVGGVESAAGADSLTGRRTAVTITSGDVTRERRQVPVNRVHPDYLRTLGLRLLHGRFLEKGDRHGAPVAVVSEVFARQNFPDGEAVGQSLRIGNDTAERTIVGVVSNVLLEGFRRQPSPVVYVPAAISGSEPARADFILVRFMPGRTVMQDLRRALAELDPLRTIAYGAIVEDAIAAGAMEVRATVYLAGPVILLALALTMSGIYGLLAQSVTQRSREVALRMALGAARADVVRLVAVQGLKLTMTGALAGASAALAIDRLVGSIVFGVPGDRPVAILVATTLIVAATLAASIGPCLRATQIDPATTLRTE